MLMKFLFRCAFLFCWLGISLQAQPETSASLIIDAGTPAGKVSPLFSGLMTEEINHCYDGGLYAELIQNRAFLDDKKTPVHWSLVGGNAEAATISLDPNQPLNEALTVSLRLDVKEASSSAPIGVANDGYWGIPVHPDTRYRASFYAKAAPGFDGKVMLSIQSEDGKTVYARAEIPGLTQEWKSYEAVLQTDGVSPHAKARYVVTVDRPGTVWFDLVSLFPPTWNDRPNGLRKDLMQMLVDLKPKFLRFPGGNYLEGDTIETRFDWKKTLGPISNRAGHPGPWEYRSTDGMGLMEFLLWCEDMGAEPVLAVYGGYSLKGQKIVAGPGLEPYIQDALDEIEYVTGPADSTWGARRAQDGHPMPFKLHYIEIGNEDFFDRSGSYDGRYTQFYNAIKAKYPELKCISTVGNEQPAVRRVSSIKPDVLDEHYYASADEFFKKSINHYEKYDRQGSQIFVGEWAAHEDARIRPWNKAARLQPPTPNMKVALGDAAWMAAMERNADLVVMQCYAPLLVNVNPGAYQWRPNLIGYDALHAYGSPSYYAIKMFSQNLGDEILKTIFANTPVQASVTRNSQTGEIFIKLVNPEALKQDLKIDLQNAGAVASTAETLILAADPEATNTLEEPFKVAPTSATLSDIHSSFVYTVPEHAIVVLKLKEEKNLGIR